MNKHTFRSRFGNALPIAIMALSVIAVGAFTYLSFLSQEEEADKNKNKTNVVVNTTNTSANTNTSTNVNGNSNTNSSNEVTYDPAVGPFSVTNAKLIAVSYRLPTDKIVTRLAKIDVTTGKKIKEAVLRTTDIPVASKQATPTSPTNIRFGKDGDSILFVSSNSYSGLPFTGLYRTSLSTPDKIETVVEYNPENLYEGDVPTISSVAFDAERNQAVFLIQGSAGQKNTYVIHVDLNTKETKKLITLDYIPEFVGFVADGSAFQIFHVDDVDGGRFTKGKGYFENISVETGSIVKKTLVYDESAMTPKLEVYGSQAHASPNLRLFALSAYYNNESHSYFWDTTTKKLTSPTGFQNAYSYGYAWSADSGKVYFQSGNEGVLYDLAKGVIATVPKAGAGLAWEPGVQPVFLEGSGISTYNVTTKKKVSLLDNIGYNDYGGYGSTIIEWVNR